MFIKQRVQINVRLVAALVLTAAIATVAVLGVHSASALENTANTLKVSPVRSDVEVKPGESKIVKTIVTNLTDGDITVRPIQNDFVAGDERGTPALVLDADKFAPTHSLKRFMAPLSDVTIPAKQAKMIEVTITVPKDAQAGGYFGAVRFAPTTPDDGGQVNMSASVASLILLTVPGDTVEKLNLTNFDIQQGDKVGTNFRTAKDLTATVRFENKGNVQVGPFGKLSVKKGKSVVYEADFNNSTPRDVILPDSARRWDVPLNDIGTFGKYTVIATFTYGATNQTIEVSKSFWVIPQSVIIMAIIAVILIIAAFVGAWFYLRHRVAGRAPRQTNRRK